MPAPAPRHSLADSAPGWPHWQHVAEVLTFRAGFNTSVVLAGVALLGLGAGLMGAFAVLRKRAMMSDTLSHATLPGIGLAFILATAIGIDARNLPVLLAGAAVTGVCGVLAVQLLLAGGRLRPDAAMGAVLSVFFGLGLVLLSYIQTMSAGNQGGLDSFIFGSAAGMSRPDAIGIGAVAALVILAAALLNKEFRLVCFDEEFAAVQGWPVGSIDLVMMGLVTLVTVVGLYSVGLVLIVALLVIPSTAARFWTSRFGPMLIASGMIGAASGYLGAAASALFGRMPTGPVIVLIAGAVFAISMIAAPHRGLAAAAIRHLRLRARIAREHLLRHIYEHLEAADAGGTADPLAAPLPPGLLTPPGQPPGPRARLRRAALRRRGLIQRDDDAGAFRLTERGQREARRVVRNHRLWEQYLTEYADVAASHVDYSADLVEHALSHDIVRDLEEALRRRGRLPAQTPPSVHRITRRRSGRRSEEPAA